MSGHSRRTGKNAALAVLADHVGVAPPDSPGGTVPKSWIEQIARISFGSEAIPSDVSKRELLKLVIELGGGEWRDGYVSEHGSTITGEAIAELTRLLPARSAVGADLNVKAPEEEGVSDMTSTGDEVELTDLEEDLQALHAQIADQLVTLAQSDETPSLFDPSRSQFELEDVSFESNAWVLQILEVQGWLYLDAEIELAAAEADVPGAVTALFSALGASDPGACFQQDGSVVRLSPVGANELALRLDSALFLREHFLENRETLSRNQATAIWVEAWDEESGAQGAPEPIRARTELWPIQDFSDKAMKGRLNLSPSYQRGDVWPTKHSQQLIISILRGIPLPSVILLKPEQVGAGGVYEVVDGKQRLTAILRFIGKHPKALAMVEEAQALQEDIPYQDAFKNDYRLFRRLWKTHRSENLTAKTEAEYYFPFRLPASNEVAHESLRGQYYCDIRDVPIRIGTGEVTVQEVFESAGNYKIPIIEYIDTAPRQIHEVFHLYNRQGKHLNAEEIRNALFHTLDLMRLLLVGSGDNPEIEQLVPFLPESEHWRLKEMGELLTDYRFGTARYRRTKLLSWLTAMLMSPSLQENGEVSIRSTAKQIDEMLHRVENEGSSSPLANPKDLTSLVVDLHSCLEAHSSFGGWAPVFRDDKDGSKWQELQLVASLIGVFLIGIEADDVDELLEENHANIFAFTSEHRRPEKTQNKTQWGFIGEVAIGLVEVVGLDPSAVHATMLGRYGVSCLPTLTAARKHYQARRA